MVSGSQNPVAAVRPGAGLPQGPKRLDGQLELVEPGPGRREWQAEPGVLARPPAGPDAAERSSAAQHVKRGHGLGQDPWRTERHGCHQRAQAKGRLQACEHPECHPRFRDRLPGGANLGDLDQVIHQGDSLQASLGGGAGHRCQPARRVGRVLTPGKSRQLQHQAHPDRPLPLLAGRQPRSRGVRGLGLGLPGGCHQVPSLAGNLRDGHPHPAQLAVQRRRRHRPVTCAVPAAALHRIGVDKHGDGGHAAVPGQPQVAQAPRRVKAQRVHHRGQAAAQPGGHYLVKQGKSVGRGIQVVLAATHQCAQPVRRDHFIRTVMLRRPDRLPGPGRPDQHDQRRIGQRHSRPRFRRTHSPSLADPQLGLESWPATGSRPAPSPAKPAGYWSRLRAGSYRSGPEIRIRNLARRWGASFPGQKRSGVFRELLTRVWA